MNHALVAGRAFGRPLLLCPHFGRPWLNTAADMVRGRTLETPSPMALVGGGEGRKTYASLPHGLVERDYRKSFPQVQDVAVIKVSHTLVNDLGSLDPYWGMTGYDGVRTQLAAAINDPEIKAIALFVDSPGGEVAGCFDLCAQIREARAIKPIWAIVDYLGCSAAYAIACSAGRITVSQSGFLGSIGVLWAHHDFSKALDQFGLKITLIYAGPHKVDGNEYNVLPDAVKADYQKQIDGVYTQFVGCVVEGRGLDEKAIRDTESRYFDATTSLSLKLCDAIMSPTDSLAELVELSRQTKE